MTDSPSAAGTANVSRSAVWLICIIASIGFAFDIYELLMLPLIIKPAIAALSAGDVAQLIKDGMPEAEVRALWAPGGATYAAWARTLFFVPALVGGVFGLLGGYLTDRLGRRRVLTASILLYAFSAMGAGFTTDLYQLLVCRCLVFIGVCVEFVAAVAWLAELFDDGKQREKVLGYTQAFSSVGGLMVGSANVLAAWMAQSQMLPAIYGNHEAWRYTLISGVIPALPLIFIRPFLPESPKWQQKKTAGQLKRPSILELFSPQLITTTIVTTLMFAASYGIAFGAIQQLPQILAGHTEIVKESETRGAELAAAAEAKSGEPLPPNKKKGMIANVRDEAVAKVTIWQEVGGLVGRFALAILAVIIISRRWLLRIFQVPALIFVPLLFYWISTQLKTDDSLFMIQLGVFVAGFLTVAQFSFWGNYIPRVFPLHLRGTGESFAANIGGRVIGTAAAYLTITFSTIAKPDPALSVLEKTQLQAANFAQVGAVVAGVYCLVGVILSLWLKEPTGESLED
ncbi:MAG: MFS transporter [Pirellulales bacterium]